MPSGLRGNVRNHPRNPTHIFTRKEKEDGTNKAENKEKRTNLEPTFRVALPTSPLLL